MTMQSEPQEITQWEAHPLTEDENLPLLEGIEYQNLVADIKKNGLLNPITLYQGKILDGRTRYRACQELGMRITDYDTYNGKDPYGFVISQNVYRRHLGSDQRKSIVAKLLKENQARSDRSIAKMVRVDHKTVAAVRKIGEESNQIDRTQKREGGDGKIYQGSRGEIPQLAQPTENIPQNLSQTSRIGGEVIPLRSGLVDPEIDRPNPKPTSKIDQRIIEDPTSTNITIAKEVGVDESTIRRHRSTLEKTGVVDSNRYDYPCIPKDLKEATLTKEQEKIFVAIKRNFKDRRSQRMLILMLETEWPWITVTAANFKKSNTTNGPFKEQQL